MPFDGTDYRGPIRPERSAPNERLITASILVGALILLLMPISPQRAGRSHRVSARTLATQVPRLPRLTGRGRTDRRHSLPCIRS